MNYLCPYCNAGTHVISYSPSVYGGLMYGCLSPVCGRSFAGGRYEAIVSALVLKRDGVIIPKKRVVRKKKKKNDE